MQGLLGGYAHGERAFRFFLAPSLQQFSGNKQVTESGLDLSGRLQDGIYPWFDALDGVDQFARVDGCVRLTGKRRGGTLHFQRLGYDGFRFLRRCFLFFALGFFGEFQFLFRAQVFFLGAASGIFRLAAHFDDTTGLAEGAGGVRFAGERGFGSPQFRDF